MVEVSKLAEDLAVRHNGLLISILEDIQEHYNYLPEEALVEVAKRLDIPTRDVYGVATFYHFFSLTLSFFQLNSKRETYNNCLSWYSLPCPWW